MNKNSKKIIFIGLTVIFSGCKTIQVEQSSQSETKETPGIVIDNMDRNTSPKEDFYKYVNGTWIRNTEIPEDRTRWGGFSVLRKSTDEDVLNILDNAKKNGTYSKESDQAKAIALFDTKLDTISRNKLGLTPLKPVLETISSIKNLKDLQTVLATNDVVTAPFFQLSVNADLNNSAMNAVYVSPSRLGLPERDYYLEEDQKSKEIREKYKAHIERMLLMLGDTNNQASEAANKIIQMETELAEPRLNKVERRDARNYNNPRSFEETDKLLSSIDLKEMVKDLGIDQKIDTIIVSQLKYTDKLDTFLKNTDIEDLKILMKWSTLNSVTSRLTTTIEEANWEFYSKYLRGQKKQRPANERALNTVNSTVGEALGQLYVGAKFPPEAKAKAEKMIANVIEAFKNRIQKLDWMSEVTKTKAIEKLNNFTVKIGYPDKWEDYSTLEVSADKTYFDNITALRKWNRKKNYEDIGQPVDKSKWGMSPQTVNAYFNPLNNEIVFPAAILQPPFYNYKADEAVNYGGIGAVIGHEISHAFDDSGARFDANGNLTNWWTKEDLERFTERGNALAEQYSAIEVLDSVFINGKFTLGENIGDLGGVLGAFDGLQMHLAENGRPDNIDGFTPEQRFFMSWTTVWRTKIREDALRTQIKTDPHSPGQVRAIQPLLNIQAFYDSFGIKKGDKMFLDVKDRVTIW